MTINSRFRHGADAPIAMVAAAFNSALGAAAGLAVTIRADPGYAIGNGASAKTQLRPSRQSLMELRQ